MTLYLSVRAQSVGGPVVDVHVVEADGTAPTLAFRPVSAAETAALARGKDLLLAAHGFNVSLQNGVRSMAWLEQSLKPSGSELFFGILWPGDFWLPVVNYPFEGGPAMDSGRRVARFCNQQLGDAHSISLVSHSLGARVVLEALNTLAKPARTVTVTAGAINRDCLNTQYAAADRNALATSTLASKSDNVLKLAYPIGDLIADLLHDDHTPFTRALGYAGPASPIAPPVAPSQIPDKQGYGHGDYFPPAVAAPQKAGGKWRKSAEFIAKAFRGQTQAWPP
ncbi:MAG: alpha/beta hydrolase [Proteobacteria bacterium]|nr:alpha/beta hydrolase [Pseudomonadota bacterium]